MGNSAVSVGALTAKKLYRGKTCYYVKEKLI